jgi:hypothetical protein
MGICPQLLGLNRSIVEIECRFAAGYFNAQLYGILAFSTDDKDEASFLHDSGRVSIILHCIGLASLLFALSSSQSRMSQQIGCSMCELFAINSGRPVAANAYLKEFFDHSHDNPHGWGLTRRECGNDIHDPEAEVKL